MVDAATAAPTSRPCSGHGPGHRDDPRRRRLFADGFETCQGGRGQVEIVVERPGGVEVDPGLVDVNTTVLTNTM